METKQAIDILNNLIVDDRLDADEKAAISDSCNYMRTLELKEGDQYDFQGWKVKKITMKQLRKFVFLRFFIYLCKKDESRGYCRVHRRLEKR